MLESEGMLESDGMLASVLRRLHAHLELCAGPLSDIVSRRGVPALRAVLSQLVPSLLAFGWRTDDVIEALDGLRFLPIEPLLMLKAQFVINLAQACLGEL